jgi:hypothetical protein
VAHPKVEKQLRKPQVVVLVAMGEEQPPKRHGVQGASVQVVQRVPAAINQQRFTQDGTRTVLPDGGDNAFGTQERELQGFRSTGRRRYTSIS